MIDPAEGAYVRALLQAYCTLADSTHRVRPADRVLARSLFARRVSLDLVLAAFLLASARRATRSASSAPLPKVRSLHYFLPVIEELLTPPLDPSYLAYLRAKPLTSADPTGR